MALSAEDAAYIVDQFGIDVNRPLITQVCRFDPWKDPLGVIEAWRLVREPTPTCSSRSSARWRTTTPRAGSTTTGRCAAADGDPDIFILSNLNNVGSVEVNAFQVHSAARPPEVDPRGLRPDRDRGALEGPPDVAGRVGGIVDQIQDGETGYLVVDSVEECAERSRQVLDDPARHRELALRGKEYVRRHFLTPRLLRDWLAQFNQLDETGADVTELAAELRSAELHGA